MARSAKFEKEHIIHINVLLLDPKFSSFSYKIKQLQLGCGRKRLRSKGSVPSAGCAITGS